MEYMAYYVLMFTMLLYVQTSGQLCLTTNIKINADITTGGGIRPGALHPKAR